MRFSVSPNSWEFVAVAKCPKCEKQFLDFWKLWSHGFEHTQDEEPHEYEEE